MAFFTPSCLISEIRGSVGDQTFSRNKYGPIVKQKLTQTVTSTAKQVTNRGYFAAAVLAWQTMSENERYQWIIQAKNWPRTDSLGKQHILPGYQFYIHCYMTKMVAGLGAPIPFFTNYHPPRIEQITVYFASSARRMDFSFLAPDDYPLIYLYFSKPQNEGVTALNPSWMYFEGQYTVDNISNRDLFFIYNNLFGVSYAALSDRYLWVGLRWVFADTGISGPMYTFRFRANQNGDIL